MSPVARSAPRFRAHAAPRGPCFPETSIARCTRATSAEPSVELSSTTITSSGGREERSRPARHSANVFRALWTGTITEKRTPFTPFRERTLASGRVEGKGAAPPYESPVVQVTHRAKELRSHGSTKSDSPTPLLPLSSRVPPDLGRLRDPLRHATEGEPVKLLPCRSTHRAVSRIDSQQCCT